MSRFRFILILIVLQLSACSALDLLNTTVPESGYELINDVRYGAHSRQSMDIYLPSKPAANAHVIVFVYGGAWRAGDRSDYEFVGQAFSSAGHTVVIPDYRLYPEVVFPEFVTDVVLAIKSLDNLDLSGDRVFDSDPPSVVMMGHSSGAHTAALISSDMRYLNNSGTVVKAMIGIAGPYDLPLDNKEVAPVFASRSASTSAIPLTLITIEHPKTLLIHGTDDERVEPKHSRRYFDSLQSLNVDSRLLMIEGASHASVVAVIAEPLQSRSNVAPAVMTFLEQL